MIFMKNAYSGCQEHYFGSHTLLKGLYDLPAQSSLAQQCLAARVQIQSREEFS